MATQPNPVPPANPEPERQRINYTVRLRNPSEHPGQMAMCYSIKKNIIVRAGRRGGKTTGMAIKAVLAFLAGKRVLYAGPTIDQVEKFWNEVKLALRELIEHKKLYKHETRHVLANTKEAVMENDEKGRSARIRAKTAFNAQTLRGDYADLLILDEFQLMDETTWSEVGAPMLVDNNGDVIFIYTPPSLESKSATKAKDPQHAAKMFKEHEKDERWLCLHFSSHDNPFLSQEGLAEVAKNMTPLAFRQEILALDTEEVPGALWTRTIIEDSRIKKFSDVPQLRRIVVAIDPSGGNTTEVGIVCAGEGDDGHIYVLDDISMKAPRPKDWAEAAISLYGARLADRILGEKNYGGDMVEETLRNVDESVSYKGVSATKGKLIRAEPLVALFQRQRMHLVGTFPQLEDEMCSYTAKPGQKSPNRLDAMVWCGIELSGIGSLGVLDFYSSGRAEAMLQKLMGKSPAPMAPVVERQPQPIGKIANSTSAAVMTNDQTPTCGCGSPLLQRIGSGTAVYPCMRCQNCGTQIWPNGKPQVAVGSRRMTIRR